MEKIRGSSTHQIDYEVKGADMIYDVAVIGAGVIGSMIARQLSMLRTGVCLIEAKADVAAGASRANSGIVHAGYDAAPGSMKAKMNIPKRSEVNELGKRVEKLTKKVDKISEQLKENQNKKENQDKKENQENQN